ncbi:GDP-mannose 4,6-dehydratase [Paenibacillus sp. FSL H7-0756]|uniref:GDP-mannose 4,6-dehydratase n=1 Tax=Paenibacillus sp. FSL H7-0756 TaxID=2954738 RepID=UPI0030FC3CA7
MKVLVTGSTGFVGQYMMDFLIHNNIEFLGSARNSMDNANIVNMNILNTDDVDKVVKDYKPTHVIHLAGQSNVKLAWGNPQATILNNTIGTLNILNAIKEHSPYSKLISIGSSEEYGSSSEVLEFIDERHVTNPKNPYGVSKLSACQLVLQYVAAYQIQAIHVRPFNHIGPRQSEGFVTQDFAKQIVDIEKGKMDLAIKVGNLDSVRDFTDVKDIVNAYYMLMQDGCVGEIYNVCSSRGVSIQELLFEFVALSKSHIEVKVDPSKFRPIEHKFIVGSNEKISRDTQWHPKMDLKESLLNILNYYRNM